MMRNNKISILLLLLLLVSMASAENVSVTKAKNVSIVCNNSSQCYYFVEGNSPAFINGPELNITIAVPVTFSYEPNTTVTTSNFTIVTQNVTVEDCKSINISTDDIATRLNEKMSPRFSELCALSDEKRDALQAEAAAQERKAQAADLAAKECQANLDAYVNITRAEKDALNSTLSAQLEQSQNDKAPLWVMLIIATLMLVVGGGFLIYKSRMPSINSGTETAPIIQMPDPKRRDP